jgi:hypothetical protein
MPSWDWLIVSFSFEQLLPSHHLGITWIANLVPRTDFSLSGVRRELLLGNDAFEVERTDPLKQLRAQCFNVVGVSQSGIDRQSCQQFSQLLLAVGQLSPTQILPIHKEQVEDKEAGITTVE